MSSQGAEKHFFLNGAQLAKIYSQLCERHQKGPCSYKGMCLFLHPQPGQGAEYCRRSPCFGNELQNLRYIPTCCPNLHWADSSSNPNPTICPKKAGCPFAHTWEEVLYHPLQYKTFECLQGAQCPRPYCAGLHPGEAGRAGELGTHLLLIPDTGDRQTERALPRLRHLKITAMDAYNAVASPLPPELRVDPSTHRVGRAYAPAPDIPQIRRLLETAQQGHGGSGGMESFSQSLSVCPGEWYVLQHQTQASIGIPPSEISHGLVLGRCYSGPQAGQTGWLYSQALHPEAVGEELEIHFSAPPQTDAPTQQQQQQQQQTLSQSQSQLQWVRGGTGPSHQQIVTATPHQPQHPGPSSALPGSGFVSPRQQQQPQPHGGPLPSSSSSFSSSRMLSSPNRSLSIRPPPPPPPPPPPVSPPQTAASTPPVHASVSPAVHPHQRTSLPQAAPAGRQGPPGPAGGGRGGRGRGGSAGGRERERSWREQEGETGGGLRHESIDSIPSGIMHTHPPQPPPQTPHYYPPQSQPQPQQVEVQRLAQAPQRPQQHQQQTRQQIQLEGHPAGHSTTASELPMAAAVVLASGPTPPPLLPHTHSLPLSHPSLPSREPPDRPRSAHNQRPVERRQGEEETELPARPAAGAQTHPSTSSVSIHMSTAPLQQPGAPVKPARALADMAALGLGLEPSSSSHSLAAGGCATPGAGVGGGAGAVATLTSSDSVEVDHEAADWETMRRRRLLAEALTSLYRERPYLDEKEVETAKQLSSQIDRSIQISLKIHGERRLSGLGGTATAAMGAPGGSLSLQGGRPVSVDDSGAGAVLPLLSLSRKTVSLSEWTRQQALDSERDEARESALLGLPPKAASVAGHAGRGSRESRRHLPPSQQQQQQPKALTPLPPFSRLSRPPSTPLLVGGGPSTPTPKGLHVAGPLQQQHQTHGGHQGGGMGGQRQGQGQARRPPGGTSVSSSRDLASASGACSGEPSPSASGPVVHRQTPPGAEWSQGGPLSLPPTFVPASGSAFGQEMGGVPALPSMSRSLEGASFRHVDRDSAARRVVDAVLATPTGPAVVAPSSTPPAVSTAHRPAGPSRRGDMGSFFLDASGSSSSSSSLTTSGRGAHILVDQSAAAASPLGFLRGAQHTLSGSVQSSGGGLYLPLEGTEEAKTSQGRSGPSGAGGTRGESGSGERERGDRQSASTSPFFPSGNGEGDRSPLAAAEGEGGGRVPFVPHPPGGESPFSEDAQRSPATAAASLRNRLIAASAPSGLPQDFAPPSPSHVRVVHDVPLHGEEGMRRDRTAAAAEPLELGPSRIESRASASRQQAEREAGRDRGGSEARGESSPPQPPAPTVPLQGLTDFADELELAPDQRRKLAAFLSEKQVSLQTTDVPATHSEAPGPVDITKGGSSAFREARSGSAISLSTRHTASESRRASAIAVALGLQSAASGISFAPFSGDRGRRTQAPEHPPGSAGGSGASPGLPPSASAGGGGGFDLARWGSSGSVPASQTLSLSYGSAAEQPAHPSRAPQQTPQYPSTLGLSQPQWGGEQGEAGAEGETSEGPRPPRPLAGGLRKAVGQGGGDPKGVGMQEAEEEREGETTGLGR
uniref:C3H1-type domain-containing protein n=1 Tax=Chromera velia CCMP2878 TaxID=1169474 RepID=A0A0G4FNP2_9ALVE|eukprot:Cvel_17965.t1-p1 / transcript=Cvel_17965.t1 / gene=Cvel_17965 / organism=Chromera_velia_CCMP2878 / gene_product=hypothetical protein / transcript_product=hypothetical protein / location=Cvel_scaffold1462:20796-26598(-) / protein_length=1588 / sequence_SO=supercontig / SO=protein_coding / is_pseudo=false